MSGMFAECILDSIWLYFMGLVTKQYLSCFITRSWLFIIHTRTQILWSLYLTLMMLGEVWQQNGQLSNLSLIHVIFVFSKLKKSIDNIYIATTNTNRRSWNWRKWDLTTGELPNFRNEWLEVSYSSFNWWYSADCNAGIMYKWLPIVLFVLDGEHLFPLNVFLITWNYITLIPARHSIKHHSSVHINHFCSNT